MAVRVSRLQALFQPHAMTRHDHRHDPPLSEADIQAYADGLLTPERAAYLRDYLGNRPGEARRVAFYGRLNEQIQRTFRPADEPLPSRGPSMRSARTAPGRWFARRIEAVTRRPLRALLMLIAVLAASVIALSGWMVASQVSAQALNNAAVMALEQAAGAHYDAPATVPLKGAGVAVAPVMPASGALVSSTEAPDLASLGMRLVNHHVVNLGPLTSASEYIYLNAENQLVVLLTAPAWLTPAQPQWAARRVSTLRLLTWNAHHRRYVLAGVADTRGLMLAADLMTIH